MTVIPLAKKYGGKEMRWNLENIKFLHQPEHFLGSFDNPKMQARHEKELEQSLNNLKTALAHEPDPLKALKILNSKDHIQFLINNIGDFRNQERLEEAVIALYGRHNAPFSSGGDAAQWESFFRECDPTLLQRCGETFPKEIKRVYRGSVSGFRKSLAWTPNKEVVDRFARRWQEQALGGEIYEVDINPENVLVYMHKNLQKRVEEIVILSPDFIETAVIRLYRI